MLSNRWLALSAFLFSRTDAYRVYRHDRHDLGIGNSDEMPGSPVKRGSSDADAPWNLGRKDTIVQLFEWPWDSVASECENWLGPAGYRAAQVSPAAEHVKGPQWWTDYQPVSYKVETKRGTRAQFAGMVSRCKAAGVGIIVDTILNHMAGVGSSGTGFNGTTYSRYAFQDLYSSWDFHTKDCKINYSDKTSIDQCQLSSLSDLKTESEYVQKVETAYLNDLMSLGVLGFRLDAAMYIETDDLGKILSGVSPIPYLTQEVTSSSGAVTGTDFVKHGDVQEFRVPYKLYNAFTKDGISTLATNWPQKGWLPSDHANIFVTNHDTERDPKQILQYKSSKNTYDLAQIFLLAQQYGSPTILSSYAFSNKDDGPPQNEDNLTDQVTCDQGTWLCQHRQKWLMNMIGLHNAAAGTERVNVAHDGSDRISFGRGKVAHVLINNGDSSSSATVATSLPDGDYCELIHDTATAFDACHSFTVTVVSGTMSVTVPARDAVAIAVGRGRGNGTRLN